MNRSAKDIAHDVYLKPIPHEEFERRLAARRNEHEDKERLALIAWFKKRYPTPIARLRYVTQRVQALRGRRPMAAQTKDKQSSGGG